MKRGIVMEVKRNKAIILCKNGRFETVRLPKGKTPGIGDTITLAGQANTGKVWTKRGLPAVSTAAVIFIFIVLLGGFGPSRPDSTIAAYVSYDVNPSFTAGVNGKMQVVSVKPWNKDAEQLFAHWQSYQYMNLKDFTRQVVQRISRKGYFVEKSPSILIASSVVLQNQAKQQSKLSHSLSHSISKIRTDTIFKNHKIKVYVKNGDAQTRQEANADGLSMGKYLLYLDAETKGKHLSVETVQNMSVSQIEQTLHSSAVSDNGGKQKMHKQDKKATTDKSHSPSNADQKDHSSVKSSGNDNQDGKTVSDQSTDQSKKAAGKKPDVTEHKSKKGSQPSDPQKNKTQSQKQTEKQQNKHHDQANQHSLHMKRQVSIGTSNGGNKNNRKHNKTTTSSEKPSSQEQNSHSHTRNNHSLKRPGLNIHISINDKILKSHAIWLSILNNFDRKTESQH